MSIGFWQILIVVILLVLLFGRGKISELMSDAAKGIKSFRKGLAEEDENKEETLKQIEGRENVPHDQEQKPRERENTKDPAANG